MTHPKCPDCGRELHRIPRNALDRVINLVYRVRRYECCEITCRWEGRLHQGKSDDPTARPPQQANPQQGLM